MNIEKPSPFLIGLMILLACGVTFIGFNFAGLTGAIVGFSLTCVGNVYALTIKPHE